MPRAAFLEGFKLKEKEIGGLAPLPTNSAQLQEIRVVKIDDHKEGGSGT